MAIPYPDLSGFSDEMAQAIARMIRLVGQMHDRFPDLDRFAVATDTEIDLAAAQTVARHVENLGLGFELMPLPFDPAALLHQRTEQTAHSQDSVTVGTGSPNPASTATAASPQVPLKRPLPFAAGRSHQERSGTPVGRTQSSSP